MRTYGPHAAIVGIALNIQSHGAALATHEGPALLEKIPEGHRLRYFVPRLGVQRLPVTLLCALHRFRVAFTVAALFCCIPASFATKALSLLIVEGQ